eukprot:m.164625 g.164625  ORF g.164625 m.164625 type:complete len:323 (-) comp12449_c0_seq1:322-1290(-)
MKDAVPPLRSFARIYTGSVLVVRQLPAMRHLVERAQELLEHHLGTSTHPTRHPGNADFVASCAAACHAFNSDTKAEQLWERVLLDVCGDDLSAHVCTDRYKLRCSPDQATAAMWDTGHLLTLGESPVTPTQSVLPPHRDTWGSRCQTQINWWAPIFPIGPDCTVELFPTFYTTPVPNTSAAWNVKDFVTWRRDVTKMVNDPSSPIDATSDASTLESVCPPPPPQLPVVNDGVVLTDGLPVVVAPGDVVMFSAAHLHRTVPNTSGLHRFSTEVRTIHVRDEMEGRGPPNIDCDGPSGPRLHWFQSLLRPKVKASDAMKELKRT